MPPGPVFNWLCVASSACDILVRVARVRISQVAAENALGNGVKNAPKSRTGTSGSSGGYKLDVRQPEDLINLPEEAPVESGVKFTAMNPENRARSVEELLAVPRLSSDVAHGTTRSDPISLVDSDIPVPTVHHTEELAERIQNRAIMMRDEPVAGTQTLLNAEVNKVVPEAPLLELQPLSSESTSATTRHLQSSKVPSSRIGRFFHYGGLAASLGYGAASEIMRRTASPSSGDGAQQSVMMTEANITRLVSKLSQMRGAALKLGQFLSIQDTHVLPADVDKIFRRVQDSAHYMPDWQMEEVLRTAFGPDWGSLFTSFDRVPFAAASIGQVHAATLAPHASPTGASARVAVKVQFPGIASSIASDLGYIGVLLTAGRLLPKGLFLDRTMAVMKQELADECDYVREAGFLRAFGAPDRLGGDKRFRVPWVWEGSTERVLVMEMVEGVSVGDAQLGRLSQAERDEIAALIIELCLLELFTFRLMQTDPNHANFLWDAPHRRLALVDFGATRAYSKEFMDGWLRLLEAAATDDRDACVEWSRKVGYLTGEESKEMLTAHVTSLALLATPFKPSTPQPFAFGPGSTWAGITSDIRAQIPVMLRERLTPPPRETYSLNRKLSGAFLLAARLDATVDTRAIWEKVVGGYVFGSPRGDKEEG
ncbi:ABC1-domain-containing protein [Mycena alexandri]|uniref:ABC1-domain-containing protein n=1 Tax=Mycena alexandri TaxID=1745969 RepID=A0AAD6XEE3_9AGAR|nr:ABC1-domain-containing protein [Mycena alexandri]